ncbi:MAG: hypothetical protein HYS40_08095 [Gemmatimonadetes bacterium]|nr:hypothetical protein [Gemmatimonadota bacterium]
MRPLLLAVLAVLWSPVPAAAQTWNTDPALALARRAIERRTRTTGDTSLHDYRTHAHGFLFFLGQFGEGLTEPPRLVKTDQLELEVYWKAPRLSKQRIVGWRDRADLPTDINYHRDHLGIVQNNFGPLIRLGEGDEVRDVPHPLAPQGPDLYDYALGDTLDITLPQRSVRVVELRVRPRDFRRPRLVGALYLDLATAELVRLAFNFTPGAYVDPQLEDVSIVLENALWEGRWWLPYRQEVEIRRRATWLDIPARGIIRGRWEIEGYEFNLGLVDRWFAGEEITPLPKTERDSFPWTVPLATALQDIAEPVRRNDLEAVRAQVARIAGRRALNGLKPRRLGVRRVSDLVHANRVEGVTLGGGVVVRGGDRLELRALGRYGFADRHPKGAVSASEAGGRGGLEAALYTEVRDVGDVPVIAPLVNSVASQEFGDDAGDYFRADGGRLAYRHAIRARGEWSAAVARERIATLAVTAAPARGAFRPNPALGGSSLTALQLAVRRKSEGFAVRRDLHVEVALEGGRLDGGNTYLRTAGAGHILLPVGATRLLVRVQGGMAGAGLPRHRAFVLGGRGTMLGDGFRSWGGRRAALAHVEWRVPVTTFRIRAGSFATVPGTITLAPYAATGWADRPVAGTPWTATPGARVTLGLGLEWLGVFRFETGVGLESRRARFTFDVTRDFWGIL